MDDSLYQAVFDTVHDGLLLVGPGGSIRAVNPAFERITGYSGADLVGKSCRVLNCTGCRVYGKGEANQWCSLYREGQVVDKRCEIRGKDGKGIQVLKKASVLKDKEGRPVGAVETFSDVTEIMRQAEEIQKLRASLGQAGDRFGILGHSPPVECLLDLIANVAPSEAPVWIHGESGVGKELVAQAVHDASPRASRPLIRVNCASLNENLLESELFGHVKGAFTGAERDRMGRFEAASGGSIFLDEIGDLSPEMQVKLLRVLESRQIERVGDHKPVDVDVRVITATNRDLEEMVNRGKFRQDLFYRINVFPICVPPLRDRIEDIPLLARAFMDRLSARSGKPITGIHPEALAAMTAYSWPGNVRELVNAMEYAFVVCHEGLIQTGHLPPRVFQPEPAKPGPTPCAARMAICGQARQDREREELLAALEQAGGNRTRAAELLGVSRVTVWKRMKKHGIQTD